MGKHQTTFEYCALSYLDQWFTYDKKYCEALQTGDEKTKFEEMKKAGTYYVVARNAPLKYDVESPNKLRRYEPIIKILDSLNSKLFKKDLIGGIQKIEANISSKYGGNKMLSLTTKFLWLKFKEPIIIYDSRARKTLKTKEGDLAGYYKKWREEFDRHQSKIADACSTLPNMHLYVLDQKNGTRKYIDKIKDKNWFHERVFDNYLWNQGSD